MNATIPAQIALHEEGVRLCRVALASKGISDESRTVISEMLRDDERALVRLRREFDANRKALDAAGV